jgi:putative SOS response-associated peptidase YedK
MCNLYSVRTSRAALARKFMLSDNRLAAFDALPAIFPGHMAPIIKQSADGERELVLRSWGFVLLRDGYAPKRVTNTRDDKVGSKFWKKSFEERRCLVPATAFCEPDEGKPACWHWFALKGNKERQLFAFAGIYRQWTGPQEGRPQCRPRGVLVHDDPAEHAHGNHQPRAQPGSAH